MEYVNGRYYLDSMECKEYGGFCNFTGFQTWYCKWKDMDFVEELCPIPAVCCVPKKSHVVRLFQAIFSLKTFYYLLSIIFSVIVAILVGKIAIWAINKYRVKFRPAVTTQTPITPIPTFSPNAMGDEWAIKTMLKLFPTIPRKELKMGMKISEGSFCVIHKAIWRDSSVATKSLRIDSTNFEIFLNEAAILWRIRIQNDQLAIAMEYMNLGSIKAFLNNQKTSQNITKELQTGDLIRIAIQACIGLFQLQSLLIIHGNICAQNFLLSGDPFKQEKLVVKLADFGNSQMLSHKNELFVYWAGERKSWPYKWMAPESYVNGGEEEKYQFSLYSDIWSFGVFLLELFTMGMDPYENLDPSKARAMLSMDPKMNALNYGAEILDRILPRDAKRIARKCFAIAPKERPKAEKLLKMLQQSAT